MQEEGGKDSLLLVRLRSLQAMQLGPGSSKVFLKQQLHPLCSLPTPAAEFIHGSTHTSTNCSTEPPPKRSDWQICGASLLNS